MTRVGDMKSATTSLSWWRKRSCKRLVPRNLCAGLRQQPFGTTSEFRATTQDSCTALGRRREGDEPEELKPLLPVRQKPENTRTIEIKHFLPRMQLDPAFLRSRTL
jgi:hypothetical protein